MAVKRFNNRLNIVWYWIKPPGQLGSFSVFPPYFLPICLVSIDTKQTRRKHGSETKEIRRSAGGLIQCQTIFKLLSKNYRRKVPEISNKIFEIITEKKIPKSFKVRIKYGNNVTYWQSCVTLLKINRFTFAMNNWMFLKSIYGYVSSCNYILVFQKY